MNDDLSLIAVTVESGVPVKFEWLGNSNLAGITDTFFADIYAEKIPSCRVEGRRLIIGDFEMMFKERRHDFLVFERLL